MTLHNKTALVLGGSGRVGRMLRRSWAQIDYTFQTRTPDAAHPEDILWDILQAPPPAHLPAFDCMIVLSGIVPKPGADFDLNGVIGLAALTAAANLGIETVLLASTSAVYGSGRGDAFHESDPPRPENPYGQSKLDMELRCRQQARALGIDLCCLRIGNVAGADALLTNAQALQPGQKLSLDVFADRGTPVRSYIGPHSLARVLSTLVHKRGHLPEVLNIAAPCPVTMRDLAQSAGAAFDLTPAPPTARQHITLDCTALTALHSFHSAESEPGEMVAQWRDLDCRR